MASVKELLKKTLNDLEEDGLKEFQWHLVNDHECVSKSDMENANRLKTVNKMVDCFEPEEAVKITVEILRKINQNNLAKQLENNHKQVPDPKTRNDFLQFPDPKTRNDFLQYSRQFTPDLNTVNKRLRLSKDNREITFTDSKQLYPDHPDRFDECPQVLCRESVCGRCYWEFEWRGVVSIAVSYKSISRKGEGEECEFGCNDQSWSLACSSSKYIFTHNDIWTEFPIKPISRRVGVYVDPRAGTLSFYSVSDTMSLIHTVQTTFTQPLYPGFGVGPGSSVKLCL